MNRVRPRLLPRGSDNCEGILLYLMVLNQPAFKQRTAHPAEKIGCIRMALQPQQPHKVPATHKQEALLCQTPGLHPCQPLDFQPILHMHLSGHSQKML